MNRYLGFYTKELFWANEEIDFSTNQSKAKKDVSKIAIRSSTKDYKLKIRRDGLIIMQISKLESIRNDLLGKQEEVLEYNSQYLAYLNTFQFLLASEAYYSQRLNYFRNKPISTYEVFEIVSGNGKKTVRSFKAAGSYAFKHGFRFVVDEKVLKQCVSNFRKLFDYEETFFLFSQMNSSFSEFSNLNFRQCIVLSWFCIELFVNMLWIGFLDKKNQMLSGTKRISKDRRALLLGMNYSSSVVTNVLELIDVLPHDIYVKINNVRNVRNKIVHNHDQINNLSSVLKDSPGNYKSKPILLTDCLDCFDVLKYFVKEFYKFEIRFPVGFSYNMI